MKIRDADILILPGLFGDSDKIWHRRWETGMDTARRVEQDDWNTPRRDAWVNRIIAEITRCSRPVVLVGHSLGAIAIVHAAPKVANLNVGAAFIVAPPDLEANRERRPEGNPFLPVPTDPLPFPSMLVASRNDPWCAFERADEFAAAWDSVMADAGDSGHIDVASGHGPWPEGMMMFARLMSKI